MNSPNTCQSISTAARDDHTTAALNHLDSVTKRIIGCINALEERLDSVILPQDKSQSEPTPEPCMPHLPLVIHNTAELLDRSCRQLESILCRIELPPCRPQVKAKEQCCVGNSNPMPLAPDYRAYPGSR